MKNKLTINNFGTRGKGQGTGDMKVLSGFGAKRNFLAYLLPFTCYLLLVATMFLTSRNWNNSALTVWA